MILCGEHRISDTDTVRSRHRVEEWQNNDSLKHIYKHAFKLTVTQRQTHRQTHRQTRRHTGRCLHTYRCLHTHTHTPTHTHTHTHILVILVYTGFGCETSLSMSGQSMGRRRSGVAVARVFLRRNAARRDLRSPSPPLPSLPDSEVILTFSAEYLAVFWSFPRYRWPRRPLLLCAACVRETERQPARQTETDGQTEAESHFADWRLPGRKREHGRFAALLELKEDDVGWEESRLRQWLRQ